MKTISAYFIVCNRSVLEAEMNWMPIDGIDDLEMRLNRQDAFWDCEVLDRPCAAITFKNQEISEPQSRHGSFKERWLDVDFQIQCALAKVKSTVYMGDAIPLMWPNLGPDFFPSLYGGEITFTDDTSYIQPFLKSWDDADLASLSFEHPYWKKMEELYAAFLDAGKNMFYTGWPDLHPGADCLVGIRGPQQMAIDLFDEPDAIKQMLSRVTADFLKVYDHYYDKLTAAGQACTGWPGIVSTRKWHVPSNDFSYMIGPEQFDEFFLPGLKEECNRVEASVHHLDGVGCLRHLDSLLSIKSLNAVQWIWGAGHGTVTDWIDVFKKIQTAGKGVQIFNVCPEHLDVLMEQLRPEGIWMQISGIQTVEEGESVLKKISRWS
jgi:hypothetical protein